MAIDKLPSQALATGSVTSDAIATGAITVADIPDGEITTAKLSSALQTTISGKANSSALALVATSGSYNDLLNKPVITPAAVSDQNNTSTGYFSLPAGTTAQRPGSPVNGMTRFNTTLGYPEWYDAKTTTWSPFNVTSGTYNVNYIIVAGGAAGNSGWINDVNTNGGGGGAGGLITGVMPVSNGQTFTATIGAGSSYIANYQNTQPSGSNTTFSGVTMGTLTALGGGGGGMQSRTGGAGGSGGGGAGGGGYSTGGSGTMGQGNAGATGASGANGTSGGGGGYGSAGGQPTAGTGYTDSVTGLTFAAGGAGCSGSGATGASGAANRGQGGGGSWNQNTAGNGGSGIVIVYYQGLQRGMGGTVTQSGNYTIHTFTTSGTFTA